MLAPTKQPPAASELFSAIRQLREEAAALRSCLFQKGLATEQAYLASLHRRRFEAIQALHPGNSDQSLLDVLQCESVALALAPFIGFQACSRITAAAPPFAGIISSAETVLHAPVGAQLFVCGGAQSIGSSSVALFNPKSNNWEVLPSMAVSRNDATAVVVDRRVYVVGGDSTEAPMECYDLDSGEWRRTSSMPQRRWACSIMGVIDGCVYVSGGTEHSYSVDSVQSYNTNSGRWEMLPSMLHRRRDGACCAVVNRALYICGGRLFGQDATSNAERYDPFRSAWEALPVMVNDRAFARAVEMSGLLYVCGGQDDNEVVLSSTECFDPRADEWHTLPAMRYPRSCAGGVAMSGSIYICGGFGHLHLWRHLCPVAEVYDPEEGAWRQLPPMLHGRGDCHMVAMGGYIYASDTSAHPFGNEPPMERFNPKDGVWEVLPQTPFDCSRSGAVVAFTPSR